MFGELAAENPAFTLPLAAPLSYTICCECRLIFSLTLRMQP